MQQNQLLDCIDIRLVKEQLRLLGHEVTDDVILSFVKGLAGAGAEQQCAGGGAAGGAGQDVQHSAEGATSQRQQQTAAGRGSFKRTAGHNASSTVQAAGHASSSVAPKSLKEGSAAAKTFTGAAAAAATQQVFADAPCRSQLADQQSPKRVLQDVGSPAALPQEGLDQRCRKFLARLADRHSTQQQQLVLPGARSRASLTDLSDSGSDGDQEQSSHSPLLTRRKQSSAVHSAAAVAGASSATGGDAATDEQHLVRAVGALDIQDDQAQWQEPLHSGGSSSNVSHLQQQPGVHGSVLDAGSDVVFEVQPRGSSDSLPRFGFRPGYKPVGIHMPPPPGQDALALMQQTSGSRSSRAGPTVAAGRSAVVAADCVAPQGCNPASGLQAAEQQQQQQALQQLAAKVYHHVALARAAPGLRASSESIISEATPGGGSSCHDARPRRVSKDGSGPSDPLYHAPASPTGGAGGSCSSRPGASGRSPVADAARAYAAGSSSSRPRPLVFEQAAVRSASAGSQQVALPGRQQSYSRAPTSSSRCSVAPSTAGSSSFAGTSSGSSSAGGSSSLSRYCQQLSWSSGRSTAMAPGVRKTDRVARFQKMQQAWQKDRYLNSGASRKGTTPTAQYGSGSSRTAATLNVRSKPSWED